MDRLDRTWASDEGANVTAYVFGIYGFQQIVGAVLSGAVYNLRALI